MALFANSSAQRGSYWSGPVPAPTVRATHILFVLPNWAEFTLWVVLLPVPREMLLNRASSHLSVYTDKQIWPHGTVHTKSISIKPNSNVIDVISLAMSYQGMFVCSLLHIELIGMKHFFLQQAELSISRFFSQHKGITLPWNVITLDS